MTNRTEYHIRPATLDDLAGLCQLEAATFSYDQIGRRSFRHLLRSPSTQVYICRSGTDHKLLAYAIILTRKNSAFWRLYSMATCASARGLGIGRQLLSHILSQAQEANISGVRLEVKCDNQAGLHLYRQLGFEVVDLIPGYYSDGTDAYKMQVSWTSPA